MIQTKNGAIAISIVIMLAVLWPIKENWARKPKDNFPLSYYPMFSKKRNATYSVDHIIGFDILGNRYNIPYKLIGTGGFNQVRRQVRKYARDGKGDLLLQKVAANILKSNLEPYRNLVKIELVKGKYHLEEYFMDQNKKPVKEKVYSRLNLDTL